MEQKCEQIKRWYYRQLASTVFTPIRPEAFILIQAALSANQVYCLRLIYYGALNQNHRLKGKTVLIACEWGEVFLYFTPYNTTSAKRYLCMIHHLQKLKNRSETFHATMQTSDIYMNPTTATTTKEFVVGCYKHTRNLRTDVSFSKQTVQ